MAKAQTFLGCLKVVTGRVPEEIATLASQDGLKAPVMKAVKKHLRSLNKAKAAAKKERRAMLRVARSQWMKSSLAVGYTDRPHDPHNELNQFEPRGFGALKRNLVQLYGNVTKAVESLVHGENGIDADDKEVIEYFNEKGGFNQKMTQSIEKLLKVKDNNHFPHRYQDMIQYLIERDPPKNASSSWWLKPADTRTKLDTSVRNAIAATAFEWLHTNGRVALGQTDTSLRQLLGLRKDDPIPQGIKDHLTEETGVYAEALALQLGRKILDRMSIFASEDADFMANDRMSMSLGFMAIAAMEDQGILQRKEVYLGHIGDDAIEAFGFRALAEGATLTREQVFYELDPNDAGKKETGKKGTPTMTFLWMDNKGAFKDDAKRIKDTPQSMRKGEELMHLAPRAFDKLFDNEPDTWNFSFEKIKPTNLRKIGRNGLASLKQAANLQKNMDVAHNTSQATMGVFNALDPEFLNRVIGMLSYENTLKVNEKSITGTNRGIQRDLDNLRAWQAQANKRMAEALAAGKTEEQAREAANFYMSAKFMNNQRMNQTGHITTQNSKMHRNLFSPVSWVTSFTKDPNTDFIHKTGTDRAFLEAVAIAFGIESGKVGGADNQVTKLQDLLSRPENLTKEKDILKHQAIRAAIDALKEYHASGNTKMSVAIQEKVAAGVEAAGEKVHSLKGLVEYARYEAHTDGEFTTDIYAEIDGVSNGPIIAIMQLIPDSADKRAVLASLAMGGMSINPKAPNFDELLGRYNLNDAYRQMGQVWAENIGGLWEQFRHDMTDKSLGIKERKQAEKNYHHMQALQEILGRFTDDEGVINKAVRDLSKYRTMQIIYSAGIKAQNEILAEGDVIGDGIYKRLENILADIAASKTDDDRIAIEGNLKRLLKAVAILTGNLGKASISSSDWSLKDYQDAQGNLDTAKIAAFKLSHTEVQAIISATRYSYGKAMENAINTVYAPVIEARAPFNNAIQQNASVYNLILKKKVEAAIVENDAKLDEARKAAKADKPLPGEEQARGRITKEQMNEILESIKDLIPKIPTPMHTKEDPSYLYLAEPGRDKGAKEYGTGYKVTQQYHGMPLHKGYVEGIPYLKVVGASAMVRATQMIDSMVANHLMGLDVAILNAHDGFPHSIKDSATIRDEANRKFFEIMSTYSMGQEIANMHEELQKNLESILADHGVTVDEQIEKFRQDRVIDVNILAEALGMDKEDIYDEIAGSREDTGYSYAKALNAFMDAYIPDDPADREEFLQRVKETVSRNAVNMAEQTTRNKKIITDAMTHVAQYPHNGVGTDVNKGTKKPKKIFAKDRNNGDIPVDRVVDFASERSEAIMGNMRDFVAQKIFASMDEDVSTDPQDYVNGIAKKVDQQNVAETFESIADLDTQARFGSPPISSAHRTHLKYILDTIVSTIMTPVQMYMAEHKINDETKGLYQYSKETGAKIWLQTQQMSNHPLPGMLGHGIRMSGAEVYAHELVHHISHFGLDNNPHIRRQINDLYDLAFDMFTDQKGANAFTIFMNDPNADLNDPANAAEIEAAKGRWKHIFAPKKNPDGSHNGLEEFIALGLTNENFKKALADLGSDVSVYKKRKTFLGFFEKNIQQTLVNIFTAIMDFIHERLFSQVHSTQIDKELENLVRALSEVEHRSKSVLYRAAVHAESTATALSIKADTKIKNLASKTMNATQLGKVVSGLKKLPELDNLLSYNMRRVLNWYNDSEQGMLASIASEMYGRTERLKPLHDLLRRRKRVIDYAKLEATKNMRAGINTWFTKRKLTPEDKTAVTKAILKADLSAIVNSASPAAIMGFLSDNAQRQARILAVMKTIKQDPDLAPYANFFENAADDLGLYMITSTSREGSMPYMNAYNIVTMDLTPGYKKLQGPAFNKAVELVDELATLFAIGYVQNSHKKAAVALMKEDWSSIQNVLITHNLLKDDALRDLFHGRPHKMEKGYTHQILDSRVQIKQGTKEERARFENMGYRMYETPIARDPNDPVKMDIFMFVSNTGTINDYQSGIMSTTRNSQRGTTEYDIQVQIGNQTSPGKTAMQNNRAMLAVTKKTVTDMFNNPRSARKKAATPGDFNYMVPKFDNEGRISEMRYVMSEHTKDTVLQQFSEFDAVMGAMTGTIVDKKSTPQINSELILALKELYDHPQWGFKQMPDSFVEISPLSQNPRYRDIYALIPPKTQGLVESTWGAHSMMVPRDIVDLAFGQRKYSIVEMFSKDAKDQNVFERLMDEVLVFALGWDNPFNRTIDDSDSKLRARAIMRAKNIENVMSQLTKLGKTNIVVRNLNVTKGNYSSNIAYLKSKGLTLEEITTRSREAILSALEYQKIKKQLDLAKSKRRLIQATESIPQTRKDTQLRNIDRLIMRHENNLARNKSTFLIDAGVMPAIVDDYDTEHMPAPFKHGVDALLDKGLGYLPGKAQRFTRNLFMVEDTEGFKMMNNAVKMTDYVGRYVLYHHYVGKGVDSNEAIGRVMDEFINFDLPTHRMIEHLNSTGLVWFSKYQLRVLKHIKNLVKEGPFTTLATFIMGSAIGGHNIINSIPGFTKDLLQNFAEPLGTLAGSVDNILYIEGATTIAGLPFDMMD